MAFWREGIRKGEVWFCWISNTNDAENGRFLKIACWFALQISLSANTCSWHTFDKKPFAVFCQRLFSINLSALMKCPYRPFYFLPNYRLAWQSDMLLKRCIRKDLLWSVLDFFFFLIKSIVMSLNWRDWAASIISVGVWLTHPFPGAQASFCLPCHPLPSVKPVCSRAAMEEAVAKRQYLLQELSTTLFDGSNHPTCRFYSRLLWLWCCQLKWQNDAWWEEEPHYIVACTL